MTTLRVPRRIPSRAILIAAIAGLGLGLLYGWAVRPVEYVDTSPDSLRADYRADYILMIAEAYHAEADLARAQQRLAALGPTPPLDMLLQALDYAAVHAFARADLERLATLADDLRAHGATPEIGSP